MRYCLILLVIWNLCYADDIIDFGTQEKRGYNPYATLHNTHNTNQTQSFTPASPNMTPSPPIPIRQNTSPNAPTKHSTTTNTATSHIAISSTPTHKGSHLSGQAFFDYYIKGKPKGIVRDFYIWQYLDENTLNATQINEAYKLLNAKNPYLRKTLNKLGKTEKMPRDVACANMNIQTALTQDNACLIISVRNRMAAFKALNARERESVIKRLKKSHPDTMRAIEILATKERTTRLFKENSIVFSMVYHALNASEKATLKSENPKQDLERLSTFKTQGFYNIIHSIVLDSKLQNLKNMLLQADITEAPHNTLFLLGVNELRFGSKQKALTYFKRAKQKAPSAFFRDRAVFWQYLVSKDKAHLEELLKSKNVNLFSIYAAQTLKKKPQYNIITHLPSLALTNPPFDTKDPYVWQNITNTMLQTSDPIKLGKVIPYFSYKDTMPQLAYLMQKIDKYANNYYIMPYEGLVKWNSREEQSLVFAIARQESYFIPTLISRSFALGIMQIMPANVKPFAKEMGLKNIEYNDLFDPKIALEMGRHFIKQLNREYKHPLFVAYAYNGGPGFLRRLLAKNELFLKNRDYEPWLSMELIPLQESRYYGMYVLANFITYEKLLGNEISLQSLLDQTLRYENKNITR